ncbi:hypothetical protein V501_09591 [Pseudogymnoascus sp. VKM F-4519 (FW-2642)]|nr:hypothetical protein V501_09591 [Pseudogymnoascus sp. VKM F-4519 (FW-2642)]
MENNQSTPAQAQGGATAVGWHSTAGWIRRWFPGSWLAELLTPPAAVTETRAATTERGAAATEGGVAATERTAAGAGRTAAETEAQAAAIEWTRAEVEWRCTQLERQAMESEPTVVKSPMPASMDGNVGGKRLRNDHDEGTKKRQRRDESPGSDIWDDSYEVDDEDDDAVVAEEPRNIHHHAVNLVREYRELEKIVPIDGTTQVITIGNLLFGAAQKGRSNLAEAVLGLHGLPHTTWMDERMATILDVVVTSVVAMLCTISSRLIYHLVPGQPSIYSNFVVDSRGRGPSPNQWADVVAALYRYMENFALTQATITDGSWTRPAINESVGSDLGAAQEQPTYIPFQNYIDQNEADPNAVQETRLNMYRS